MRLYPLEEMSLAAGTRLGPYEVLAPLGAGGMGEVWKARDTRLAREVALKVLPEALALDRERLNRFEQEARAASALNHPNIVSIYDVGRSEATSYIAMELVEGKTVRELLETGPLSFKRALSIAAQAADGLAKAHSAGIVHRDLKPENLMVTSDGFLKILDFGLAKLVAEAPGGLSDALTYAGSQTASGLIVGTVGYMSPEQASAGPLDFRSDQFSLGAILYETVAGNRAFARSTVVDTLSAILHEEPEPIASKRPETPVALRWVIERCLAKEPEERYASTKDLARDLASVRDHLSETSVSAGLAAMEPARVRRRGWLLPAAAALVLGAVLGLSARGLLSRSDSKLQFERLTYQRGTAVRFEIATPPEIISIDTPRISPDGRYLAFNATDSSGKTRIWVRALSSLSAQPLAGTEGTTRPFWSPDSRFLGFFAEGKLKKIEVSGGPAQKICDAPRGADGSWSPEGVILYDGREQDPIYRVAAAGGVPAVAAGPDAARKETMVGWPEFLPDGKHFLYMALGQKADDNTYRIGSLDSKESKPLFLAQTLVTYAPPGYLLFVRDKTLVAQRFDPKEQKTLGEPVPLAEQIGTDSIGLARFTVSREGTLAYRTGESGSRLLWVDRVGKEIETAGDPDEIADPALSPGGDRLAFDLVDARSGKSSIWIRDLARGVSSRFSFGATDEAFPIWSPDGSRVVFSVFREPAWDLFEKPAAGEGEAKELLKTNELKVASDWSRDSRYIAFSSRGKETNWDIWMLPTFGDKKPIPFLKTGFAEKKPVFSPDGRYVAYQSNESGRAEIYVQGFPGPGGKWQVSTAGGNDPSWRADGKEIFYRAADQKLMGVEVTTGDTFRAGVPKPLFIVRVQASPARNCYIPVADGQRFLLVAPPGREAMTPTTVVLNWSAELTR